MGRVRPSILLSSCANWGYRGSSTSPNWGSGSGGHPNGVSILWNFPARVLPIYNQRIFQNTRSTARRACDNLLMEKRTYRIQSHSTCCNPIRGRLINQHDDALDDFWYFSVRQYFLWRISFGSFSISDFSFLSVTSVSSSQLNASWIAFGNIFD